MNHAFSVTNIEVGIYYLPLTGPTELTDQSAVYGDYKIRVECIDIRID